MNNIGEEPPLGHPPGPRKPPAGIKYRKYPGVTHKYCSEIHSYQSWVDTEQRRTRDGLHLTRRNVDDYFQKIVVWERYNVNNDTASGIASALQVFANNHEFRYNRDNMPSPKPKIFKVRDPAKGADCPVAQALFLPSGLSAPRLLLMYTLSPGLNGLELLTDLPVPLPIFWKISFSSFNSRSLWRCISLSLRVSLMISSSIVYMTQIMDPVWLPYIEANPILG